MLEDVCAAFRKQLHHVPDGRRSGRADRGEENALYRVRNRECGLLSEINRGQAGWAISDPGGGFAG